MLTAKSQSDETSTKTSPKIDYLVYYNSAKL